MKLEGIKKSFVEIEYVGSYSDLIDEIFKEIYGCSLKSTDNIIVKDDVFLFQSDEAVHGSPMYETFKEIKKKDNEKLFYLANSLYLIYQELLGIKRKGDN